VHAALPPDAATHPVAEEKRGTTSMIETQPSGEGPEPTPVLRVAPQEALRSALWWVLPATALIAGGWTAAMVPAAAGAPFDLSTTLAWGAAAAVALFGGMWHASEHARTGKWGGILVHGSAPRWLIKSRAGAGVRVLGDD
jgi:hypothetical protein